jgi:hypothetical protein
MMKTSEITDRIEGTGAYSDLCPGLYLGGCPPSFLQFVSEYASVAEWLYLSNVPSPRNSNEVTYTLDILPVTLVCESVCECG